MPEPVQIATSGHRPGPTVQGDMIRATAMVYDQQMLAVDPSIVRARVRDPHHEVTTYTFGTDAALVREQEGVYQLDVALDEPGTYIVRWEADGSHKAAAERSQAVEPELN